MILRSASNAGAFDQEKREERPTAFPARAEKIACFPDHYARVAASPFPILSGDQSAERESSG
jgi:hypothetical protein